MKCITCLKSRERVILVNNPPFRNAANDNARPVFLTTTANTSAGISNISTWQESTVSISANLPNQSVAWSEVIKAALRRNEFAEISYFPI